MALVVRPAIAADFEAIAELTNGYIATTIVHFGHRAVSADELRAAWEAERTTHPFVVAEHDGAFAGYAKSTRWRSRDAYAWTAETSIYVAAATHRRGAGRALYEALVAACSDAGFHALVAGIVLPNEASVGFHEALGFRPVGTFREVGWKLGRWNDVLFVQRMLRDATQVPVSTR